MGYSPAKLPEICTDCGLVICGCYTNEVVPEEAFEYDSSSTDPDIEVECDSRGTGRDEDWDCFEFHDMAENWR